MTTIYIPDLGETAILEEFESINVGKLPKEFNKQVTDSEFGTSLFYVTESGRTFEIVRL